MTIVNSSLPSNDGILFKMVDFSERYISSGALVPLDYYVMLMESSSVVFPSEVIIFVSEILSFPLVEFLPSGK